MMMEMVFGEEGEVTLKGCNCCSVRQRVQARELFTCLVYSKSIHCFVFLVS